MQTSQTIGPESQRRALEAVLRSKAFDRSEQLRLFLRYVCERQWEGRAGELTEYSIGVDVLGRGPEFSPGEDSIVRNRAYALRKKLDEFYENEGANEPLRIDVPKGSYAPRFVEVRFPDPPVLASEPVIAGRSADRRMVIAALLGGAALGAAGMRIGLGARLRRSPARSLRQFWGPVLEESGNVVLCIGTPAQSFLRTLPSGDFTIRGTIPSEKLIEEWFAGQKVERNGPRLVQVPTFNSPLWGDAAGAARVTQFLGQYGVATEVVAERVIALPALRNRNVIFLATTEYSSAAVRLLKGLPLGIRFDEVERDHIPVRFDANGRVVERFPVRRLDGSLSDVYGLVTRLRGDGDGDRACRYVVLSGVSSAGILAAAEYVTSQHHLEALEQKLTGAGDAPLQVLIRVRSSKTLPLSFEYATHTLGEAK